MSAHLVPFIQDLFSKPLRAAKCSAEQIATLPWVLRFVSEKPEPFEEADSPESLGLERRLAV